MLVDHPQPHLRFGRQAQRVKFGGELRLERLGFDRVIFAVAFTRHLRLGAATAQPRVNPGQAQAGAALFAQPVADLLGALPAALAQAGEQLGGGGRVDLGAFCPRPAAGLEAQAAEAVLAEAPDILRHAGAGARQRLGDLGQGMPAAEGQPDRLYRPRPLSLRPGPFHPRI